MYFDAKPKTSTADLFGREYLLHSLVSYLEDEQVRLVVLKGLRRTGKTSLLNVALQETKALSVKIDVREAPSYDYQEFLVYLSGKIKEAVGESLFSKLIQSLSSVEVSYKDIRARVDIEAGKKIFSWLQRLDAQLKQQKRFLILAFDEAQFLAKTEFPRFLAAVYDNYPRLKLLLTGSEVGVLGQLLGQQDAHSPLFGRPSIEIEIKKLSNDQINQFLVLGFRQIRQDLPLKEIKEVVENFDGIIGWATHYGWFRKNNFPHTQAILKVVAEGSKLVRAELEQFLTKREKKKYLVVLHSLSKGHNRWALLKHEFSRRRIKLSDHQLNLYLTELLDYGFIEKSDQEYFIADSLLIRALD